VFANNSTAPNSNFGQAAITTTIVRELSSLLGDFNDDGTVDAADYVFWRKIGSSSTDYNDWRANFGNTSFSGSGARTATSSEPRLTAVPEPAAASLLMFSSLACIRRRKRRIENASTAHQ
jgi:hypothetical protein